WTPPKFEFGFAASSLAAAAAPSAALPKSRLVRSIATQNSSVHYSTSLNTPPGVPAYMAPPRTIVRARTSRYGRPSLRGVQVAPPSELLNTPSPEVARYTMSE